MSNLLSFEVQSPRADVVLFLQDAIEVCARQAALDVGLQGVQNFFAGYKDSIEAARIAA